MRALIELIRREPARVFGIAKAVLCVGLAFGLHLTPMQQDAMLGLALLILGSGEGTRAMVMPTAKLPPKEPPA